MEKKITQIDLGIDRKNYPFIKKKFNKPGNRKFIYIGNDYAYNNFAKNTSYLNKISKNIGERIFGTVGNKKIGKIDHYGWLDLRLKKSRNLLSRFDFLIQTSNYDANPSTVFRSMSWGLIPVITKQCGYTDLEKVVYIPLNNLKGAEKKINQLQNIDQKNNFLKFKKII